MASSYFPTLNNEVDSLEYQNESYFESLINKEELTSGQNNLLPLLEKFVTDYSRLRAEPDQMAKEKYAKLLIGNALETHIQSIDAETCEASEEDSFFVADLGEVYRRFVRWKQMLPRVHPFYAVKCNPDPVVLSLLSSLGTGFDCASKNEIERVLKLGVQPERIIYANPCKVASYVRFAASQNVSLMTFDNSDELYKIKRYYPDARLLLRISTDDSEAQCQLSNKYGASLYSAKQLLELAKTLELTVTGVSFHVGSGAVSLEPWQKALKDSHEVFKLGRKLGYDMNLLDIGGGFVASTFDEVAQFITPYLDQYFPEPNVSMIAEPGRYFVADAFTMASHVIAKRAVDEASNQSMIYLNDGVYKNLNCILFDHQVPIPKVLTHAGEFKYFESERLFEENKNAQNGIGSYTCSIWGPTCDGLDCISKSCQVTYPLQVGDWMYFTNLGAYTCAATTQFNGFEGKCNIIYVCSEPGIVKGLGLPL